MKIFISFLLVLCSFVANGQKVAISAHRMNIVYVGIPNYMTIVAEKYPCETISVSTDNGKIEKQDRCTYIYYPENIGNGTIEVYNKKKKLIDAQNYRVKSVHATGIQVGGKLTGNIKKTHVLPCFGIIAELSGFDIQARFIVQNYKIEIIHDGSITFSKEIKDPLFEEDIKAAFKKLNTHDRILFTNIKVRNPDGLISEINPTLFTITE